MSFQTGTATDYSNLLDLLDTFVTSQGMTLAPTYVGTGNGPISGLIGGSASVAEVFTVLFTSSTAFSVTGSISGALAAGVVGTPYVSTKIKFTITAGGTAFVAGDQFTISTTPPWTSKRRTSGDQMIWQAPGNGNLDAILVGAKMFSNVGADYYNWRLGGFTAFNSALLFENQAGYLGGPSQAYASPVLNLWNSSIPYWFIANGRRVIVIAKISTVYVVGYLGFISSYMSPGAFPYPLAVIGSMGWDVSAGAGEPGATDTRWRWSYVGNELSNFAKAKSGAINNANGGSFRLRLPSGVWMPFDSSATDATYGRVWPSTDVQTQSSFDMRDNLDGSYTILPFVLHDETPNIYGEPDGVGFVTGHGQSSENTITVGRDQWLVVQDVNRTTNKDYFAVRLN